MRRRRRLLAAVALVAVSVAGFLVLRASSAFAVQDVRVRGVSKSEAAVLRREVREIVGSSSLLALDPDAVAARLRRLPTVEAAWVDRSFPNTLAVRIRPEVPVAVLASPRGPLLVARSGRVIGPAGAASGLPLLAAAGSPPAPGARLEAEAVRRELGVVRALDPRVGLRLRSVEARPDGLVVRTARGIELRLGDPADAALKLRTAATVMHALRKVRIIDVSVPTLPAARTDPDAEAAASAVAAGDAATTDAAPADGAARAGAATPVLDAPAAIVDVFGSTPQP